MMVQELLFLLLPLAALSGWLIGRRRSVKGSEKNSDCLPRSSDYFKGLNYLLNEQSDKALEVFIQMSELDGDTVEIHFALASLLAKRGEVDRAIRIHQNLIARPMLSPDDKNRALYELAKDYLRAGLLDRAESLFHELVDNTQFGQLSRSQLLEIYQQEKEWEKAIQIARRLDDTMQQPLSHLLAHFYCEQADEALARGDSSLAIKLVKRAFNEERKCVRATLLEGAIHLRNNKPKAAIKTLKRVEQQNIEYLPLILEPLQQAYEQLGNSRDFVSYLRKLPEERSMSTVLELSEQLLHHEGEEQAVQLLQQALRRQPSLRILNRLIQLRVSKHPENPEFELTLKTLDNFLQHKPIYHCDNCGFSSRTMHWQCPSCKQWDRVKPLQAIETN